MFLTCGSDWTPVLSAHRAEGGQGWARTPAPCWPVQLSGCSCRHIRRKGGFLSEGRQILWGMLSPRWPEVSLLTALTSTTHLFENMTHFWWTHFPSNLMSGHSKGLWTQDLGMGTQWTRPAHLPAPKRHVAGPAVSSCWQNYSLPIQPNHFWIFVSVTAMKLPLTQSSGEVTLRELREGALKRSPSWSWGQAG